MKKPIYSSAVPEVVAKAIKPLLDFQNPGMSLDDLANLIDQYKQFGVPIPSSLLFLKDGNNFNRIWNLC